jgi:hypothetical protein
MNRRTGDYAMKGLLVCLVIASCLLLSCSASEPDSPAQGEALNGTWVGDFGPAFYDRNTISLELHWDGKEVTGLIRPGVQGGRMYRNFEAFPIENTSFDPKTATLKFEATFKARSRRYLVEGKLKKNTLTGTWNRPDDNKDGDFKLTKS